MEFGGSRNNQAFYERLSVQKQLPDQSSITYLGAFNNSFFPVADVNTNFVMTSDVETATWNNPISNINESYVALLIKSKYDGIGNRTPIDLVFVIDKSGSMQSSLGKSDMSCIELAKSAVLKLIEQLSAFDNFGIIALDNKAYTVIPMTSLKDLQNTDYKTKISSLSASGGTNLSLGYIEALKQYEGIKKNPERERRIIFSTDMNDLSSTEFEDLISNAATKHKINTSIIGIGVQVDTSFLERISNSQGFNYFCVMNENQLEEIVIQNFNYNYFPICHNLCVSLKSSEYELEDSFGTNFKPKPKIKVNAESKQHKSELGGFIKKIENFIFSEKKQTEVEVTSSMDDELTVTEVSTVFASPMINRHILGGLILLKLKKKDLNKTSSYSLINLTYNDLNGTSYTAEISLKSYGFDKTLTSYGRVESELMSQALRVYLATSFMKLILQQELKVQSPGFFKVLKHVVAFIKNNTESDYLERNKGEIEKITTLISKISEYVYSSTLIKIYK